MRCAVLFALAFAGLAAAQEAVTDKGRVFPNIKDGEGTLSATYIKMPKRGAPMKLKVLPKVTKVTVDGKPSLLEAIQTDDLASYTYDPETRVLLAIDIISLDPPERGRTLSESGQIEAVDAKHSLVSVRIGRIVRTYRVSPKAEILHDDKPAALADLPRGAHIAVFYREARTPVVFRFAIRSDAAGKSDRPLDLFPDRFKVGQVGVMGQGDMPYKYDIEKVLDDKQMIVRLPGAPKIPFIVRGLDTKESVEGQRVELPGLWRIAEVVRMGGRGYFVAVPEKKK